MVAAGVLSTTVVAGLPRHAVPVDQAVITVSAAVAVVVAIHGDRTTRKSSLVVVVDAWPWAGNTATYRLGLRDLGTRRAVGITAIQRNNHAAVGTTVNLEVVSWSLRLAVATFRRVTPCVHRACRVRECLDRSARGLLVTTCHDLGYHRGIVLLALATGKG